MSNLRKMTNLLDALTEHALLVPSAQRIELKRTRSGFFRLYVACGANVKPAGLGPVHQLCDGIGITANPFAKAGAVQAVTFVDNAEDATATDNATSQE